MRFCYQCFHITGGDPLFCNRCGRSYDETLCPRLHTNPRHAEVCSRCGSRDLSLPQERAPLWFKPVAILVTVLPGFVLLFLSMGFLGYFIYQLLTNPSDLVLPMLDGLVLAALWLGWMQTPRLLIKVMARRLRPGREDR